MKALQPIATSAMFVERGNAFAIRKIQPIGKIDFGTEGVIFSAD